MLVLVYVYIVYVLLYIYSEIYVPKIPSISIDTCSELKFISNRSYVIAGLFIGTIMISSLSIITVLVSLHLQKSIITRLTYS